MADGGQVVRFRCRSTLDSTFTENDTREPDDAVRPPSAANLPDPTIRTSEGWHCLHAYFRVDESELRLLDDEGLANGREAVCWILDPERDGAPERMQTFVVSGGEADLGIMLMDPDPLVIDRVLQDLRRSPLGAALDRTYSFVSITEVSEYVPTEEQYAEKLRKEEGLAEGDPAYEAKVNAYAQRLPAMNKQRLYPDIPPFPVHCFYPMNKIREPHANWFTLPFSKRRELMAEHATSGIKFAGRVSQLITASTGFDDWEWGVTLWGRAPEHIKEIVYTMRFDQASAKYAEFGPFFVGYVMTAGEALEHLRI